MTNLGNLWPKPPKGTTPYFHCELQLISYLDLMHFDYESTESVAVDSE